MNLETLGSSKSRINDLAKSLDSKHKLSNTQSKNQVKRDYLAKISKELFDSYLAQTSFLIIVIQTLKCSLIHLNSNRHEKHCYLDF